MRLFLLFFLANCWAFAQDPHQRKASSVEELLEKNNANQYLALKNKSNFLVIDHLKSGWRERIYTGEVFRFKTIDGIFLQEEISEITDSTFTILRYNDLTRQLETLVFKPSEIEKYYKREVRKGIRWGLTWASFGTLLPLLYDWVQFRIPPTQNTNALIGIPVIQAGLILINNRDKFFNSRKFTSNRRLKIFKTI
jgi:hypothetical protein